MDPPIGEAAMSTIIAALRDIVCVVTNRCRPLVSDDPLLTELRAHEMEAWRQVGKMRAERRQRLQGPTGNVIEDEIFPAGGGPT